VALGGQAVAPSAKIYWNKETQVVYVDAAGLEPPEGMVYQIWSLNYNSTLSMVYCLTQAIIQRYSLWIKQEMQEAFELH
jgi:hypothetical protein